jgi:hypothetical protein
LKQPIRSHNAEHRGERWWLIGYVRVLGESERWEVLYDAEADEGRLHAVKPTRSS